MNLVTTVWNLFVMQLKAESLLFANMVESVRY